MDLAKLQRQGRFIFIDGLSALFTSRDEQSKNCSPDSSSFLPSTRSDGALSTQTIRLGDWKPASLESAVLSALAAVNNSCVRTTVILDTPTLPLSVVSDSFDAADYLSAILELRSKSSVSAMIISTPADDAFIHALKEPSTRDTGESVTRVDEQCTAFVMDCVYQAHYVVACRKLGTGWAKDVSGVVRLTRGESAIDPDQTEGALARSALGSRQHPSDGEWLYHVAADGNVKVWDRGSRNDT